MKNLNVAKYFEKFYFLQSFSIETPVISDNLQENIVDKSSSSKKLVELFRNGLFSLFFTVNACAVD